MFNFDYVTKEDMKKQSKLARYSWPPIQNINSWKFLIWKNKWLIINPINHEPDIDKIYLYAKDPYEAKYQLLINKKESAGLKYFNDSKAFIEYSNDMDRIYENIE